MHRDKDQLNSDSVCEAVKILNNGHQICKLSIWSPPMDSNKGQPIDPKTEEFIWQMLIELVYNLQLSHLQHLIQTTNLQSGNAMKTIKLWWGVISPNFREADFLLKLELEIWGTVLVIRLKQWIMFVQIIILTNPRS